MSGVTDGDGAVTAQRPDNDTLEGYAWPPDRRAIALTVALCTSGLVATRLANVIITRFFPDKPMPDDLILESIPFLPYAEYVADIAVLAAGLIALIYIVTRQPNKLLRGLVIFALMYLLRAVFIVLTPLANPHGADYYGILGSQNGMWPSGHSANVMLSYLLLHSADAGVWRNVVLALAFVEWIMMLFSRGHYSIDIIGAILLAYFVWAEWTRGSLFDRLKRVVEPDA
ncbi:MAG: phosphatase PAP2-related protein [Coriobacteriia bacterium]